MSDTVEIVSWSDARRAGLKRYFTGKPCSRGHIAERVVSNKNCVGCFAAQSKRHYEKNPDSHRAQGIAYYWKNADRQRELRRKRGKENRAAEAEYTKAWFAANPEKLREYQRRFTEKHRDEINLRTKEWRKKNVAKQRFYSARRRAMEYAAIPKLPDDLVPIMQSEILAIYAECRVTQELTGVRHDVDHIFPIIKGGVHAPWNLRIVLRSYNQSKKDKWPDDEPVMVMWQGLLVSRIMEMEK